MKVMEVMEVRASGLGRSMALRLSVLLLAFITFITYITYITNQ
jgi:hypothetical protein